VLGSKYNRFSDWYRKGYRKVTVWWQYILGYAGGTTERKSSLVHQISNTSSSILLTWSNPKSDKSLQSWGIWQLFSMTLLLGMWLMHNKKHLWQYRWCQDALLVCSTKAFKLQGVSKQVQFLENISIYLLGLMGCDPRNFLKILKCGGWIMELCMWIPKVQALEEFSKAGSMHVPRHVLDNGKKHTEGLASLDAVTNSSLLPLS
jgi:hypothetical protein